ncbi:helix-turn-helix domain-containing protein [Methylocucumis oryzae]|uniref:Putative Fis-like DNA-binding protein n=1 Tax=Methylocucumis oryzae TaxID=1632867 RepID=A0A0F3IKG2_9GAMM|nr:helix-turn-helix domain-containing protein [Methylocucumis oryzae]KJV07196.1 Fis family transcriptional regulator [Methylocucumis oryzae]
METAKQNIPIPLSLYVKERMEIYFAQLSDHDAVDLHALVIGEVEKPLLEAALAHSGYNQTKAAKVLGLSRSTLRKKMEFYGLSQ